MIVRTGLNVRPRSARDDVVCQILLYRHVHTDQRPSTNPAAVPNAGVDANPRVCLDDGAATNDHAARDACSSPDARVVADLHVVVDLDVVLDDGGRHGSLLHDGQGPNLDRAPDDDSAQMRNPSLVAGLVAHEPESLGPDDGVRTDDGPFADGHAGINPHSGPEHAASSDGDIWTNRAEWLDHGAVTDVDVALDDRERRDDRVWRDLPSFDPMALVDARPG